MTRINANIPPDNLCDQHLLAEHREIIRVRHVQSSTSKAPAQFTLGSGHVLFFKDKLGFIYARYNQLYAECKRRNFDVQPYHELFEAYDLSGQWVPTPESKAIIISRITERLSSMSDIRYEGKRITVTQAINLLPFNYL